MARGTTWPPICHLCGKFMSYNSLDVAVSWQPYGSYGDVEPPPAEYAHRECWDNVDNSRKETIKAGAYGGVKP